MDCTACKGNRIRDPMGRPVEKTVEGWEYSIGYVKAGSHFLKYQGIITGKKNVVKPTCKKQDFSCYFLRTTSCPSHHTHLRTTSCPSHHTHLRTT
eukprot:gene27230-46051_t